MSLVVENAVGENLRSLSPKKQPLVDLDETCVGLIGTVQYDAEADPSARDTEFLACQTPSGLHYRVEASKDWIEEKMSTGELKSGKTLLTFPAGTKIDKSRGRIQNFAPPGLAKREETPEEIEVRSRRRLATGTRSVLIVRVIAAGGSVATTASQDRLSDSIFGNGLDGTVDPVTLKSQFADCSNNQLNFVPTADRSSVLAGTPSITNGSTTVTISTQTSVGEGQMELDVTARLKQQFGVTSPSLLADHVMYCLPPNTFVNGGIGYAYINSWNSVYNDNWCTYVSIQMHELGE